MLSHMYGSRIHPNPLPHLWEKSKMVVDEFLRLHQSLCFPRTSPDLNPMDYYVFGAVEKDTNRRASTTKAQLIDRIKVVFETLSRETVISAYSRFRISVEAVMTLMVVNFSETC